MREPAVEMYLTHNMSLADGDAHTSIVQVVKPSPSKKVSSFETGQLQSQLRAIAV